MKFRKGDRIKIINRRLFNSKLNIGDVGTIMGEDDYQFYIIHFDSVDYTQNIKTCIASEFIEKIIPKSKYRNL